MLFLLARSPSLPQKHTHTLIVKTFLSLPETEREEGAGLIKVGSDTRGDILLSNHDRGSQLHTVSGRSERVAAHSEPCKIHQKAHDHMCLALILACFVSHGPFKPLAPAQCVHVCVCVCVCGVAQVVLACRPQLALSLALSVFQPHPCKSSLSSSTTSQTSLHFPLLWNVVRRGLRAIYGNLLYFSVTAVCLTRRPELVAVSSAGLEELAWKLTYVNIKLQHWL